MSDRFVAPRPTFVAPTNEHALEVMTPVIRETTPAPSVVAQLRLSGKIDLAAMIASAQAEARKQAKVAERDKKPHAPRKAKDGKVEAPKVASPKFQPSDVVGDAEFIKRTRHLDPHTSEAKALFYANGGEDHLKDGLTYAQGWDNLRREKVARLSIPTGVDMAQVAPYHRLSSVPQGSIAIEPGAPTPEDRVRQVEAHERARRVVINERWAGISKK